ncbi:FecR family protein [Pedobacter sp. SYP-B3415]|uniref:FecR family protein n=1 Tax=Pedobacter sp. SYP-B3415 TaxID=2496641 RepID=UPI00101CC620|nr:FecR family protein [Pedobacter sp. SYP-B3415]
MTREEYILLYEKYVSGKCTPEEKQRFEAYADKIDLENYSWDEQLLGNEQDFKTRVYGRLSETIEQTYRKRLKRQRLMAAAAAFLIMSLTVFLYQQSRLPSARTAAGQAAIKPGTNTAILTLADGSTVVLEKSANGIVANQGQVEITRNGKGEIIYNDDLNAQAPSGNVYNIISTPKGAETQLVLADGTKIWLNAASSVRFPIAFSGGKRLIELSGEAYLEVAEDKTKPFMISVGGTEIEVLGTKFNVNAYAEKPAVATTLVQGSVRFKSGNNERILKPGQQGLAHRNGKLDIKAADMTDVLAWKNGLFVYNGANIKEIMDDVSRWYNIDVEYTGQTENKNFDAKMNRTDDIRDLLKNMELTGTIKFKIEGRRVTVMAK